MLFFSFDFYILRYFAFFCSLHLLYFIYSLLLFILDIYLYLLKLNLLLLMFCNAQEHPSFPLIYSFVFLCYLYFHILLRNHSTHFLIPITIGYLSKICWCSFQVALLDDPLIHLHKRYFFLGTVFPVL